MKVKGHILCSEEYTGKQSKQKYYDKIKIARHRIEICENQIPHVKESLM